MKSPPPDICWDPGTLPEDVDLSDEGLRSGLVGSRDANDRRDADGV